MKLGQIDGELSKLYQLPHISKSRPWEGSNSHFFQNFNLIFANQTFLFGEVAQICLPNRLRKLRYRDLEIVGINVSKVNKSHVCIYLKNKIYSCRFQFFTKLEAFLNSKPIVSLYLKSW